MTPECFEAQVGRLRLRFGEKSFDHEFIKLLSREMSPLPNDSFIKIVDTMIGTRPHNSPPILTHFREMKLQSEKYALSRNTQLAANAMSKSTIEMKDILSRHGYEGAANLKEAVEIQILKNKFDRINSGEVS